jgi:hypothetical protein
MGNFLYDKATHTNLKMLINSIDRTKDKSMFDNLSLLSINLMFNYMDNCVLQSDCLLLTAKQRIRLVVFILDRVDMT